MPRPARSAQEVEDVRQGILDQALSLIVEEGFEKFSMRRLARRLGVAAVTIYSYYENKDELYLAVLTKGFERLYEQIAEACEAHKDPLKRLESMIRGYVDFGLNETNFYVLMFTWNVPKYQDYVNTPSEPTANHELMTALKVFALFRQAAVDVIEGQLSPEDAAGKSEMLREENIRFYIISGWSFLHGYLSGCSNSLLSYMQPEPEALKEKMVGLALSAIQLALAEYKAGRLGVLGDVPD